MKPNTNLILLILILSGLVCFLGFITKTYIIEQEHLTIINNTLNDSDPAVRIKALDVLEEMHDGDAD